MSNNFTLEVTSYIEKTTVGEKRAFGALQLPRKQ